MKKKSCNGNDLLGAFTQWEVKGHLYCYIHAFRRKIANPEDVEFLDCQDEMNRDLLKGHLEVERIIGLCSHFLLV